MNKVILVGRITRDPETRFSGTGNENKITRFSVAVNRRFKNAEGNYDADFPSCVAFGKTAEFIEKYFKKGMMIGIIGRLTTGSYTNKDRIKVYTTDVTVEEAEFVESKNSSNTAGNSNTPSNSSTSSNDGFMNIPDGIDEELPFS